MTVQVQLSSSDTSRFSFAPRELSRRTSTPLSSTVRSRCRRAARCPTHRSFGTSAGVSPVHVGADGLVRLVYPFRQTDAADQKSASRRGSSAMNVTFRMKSIAERYGQNRPGSALLRGSTWWTEVACDLGVRGRGSGDIRRHAHDIAARPRKSKDAFFVGVHDDGQAAHGRRDDEVSIAAYEMGAVAVATRDIGIDHLRVSEHDADDRDTGYCRSVGRGELHVGMPWRHASDRDWGPVRDLGERRNRSRPVVAPWLPEMA